MRASAGRSGAASMRPARFRRTPAKLADRHAVLAPELPGQVCRVAIDPGGDGGEARGEPGLLDEDVAHGPQPPASVPRLGAHADRFEQAHGEGFEHQRVLVGPHQLFKQGGGGPQRGRAVELPHERVRVDPRLGGQVGREDDMHGPDAADAGGEPVADAGGEVLDRAPDRDDLLAVVGSHASSGEHKVDARVVVLVPLLCEVRAIGLVRDAERPGLAPGVEADMGVGLGGVLWQHGG